MGLLTCPCKCVLGIINGVIMLVGIALAAAGGFLLALASNPTLIGTLEDTINKIIESINIIPGADVDNPVKAEYVELIEPAGIVLLVVGLFILAVTILGYCGLTCYTVILKLYVVVLIVILVAEVVIVAVLFSGALNDEIQKQIQKAIDKEYNDIDDKSIFAVIPNIIMIELHCCGINGYHDFDNAVKWNKTRVIDIGGRPQLVDLVTPIACCETTGTFPEVKVLSDRCATAPNDEISNWNKGCWKSIGDELSPYRTGIILVSVAVMLVQLAIIITVIVIICIDSD